MYDIHTSIDQSYVRLYTYECVVLWQGYRNEQIRQKRLTHIRRNLSICKVVGKQLKNERRDAK